MASTDKRKLTRLSIKELVTLCRQKGISTDGCTKKQLVQRLSDEQSQDDKSPKIAKKKKKKPAKVKKAKGCKQIADIEYPCTRIM